jgi:hypothetical protein
MNKFKRTNFYNQNEVNNIIENDLVDNNWNLFKVKREVQYFTLTRGYIQRPDLLSLKLYGDQSYWWILSKVNKIDDWWNDLKVDEVIMVPDKLDIDDWYFEIRKR